MTVSAVDLEGKVAIVTGAARRIGAAIARTFHDAGMNVVVHYHASASEAHRLRDELDARRAGSVSLVSGDLRALGRLEELVAEILRRWNRLDVLVNNASAFYPTPVASVSSTQWDDMMEVNLKAPFFLAQAAAPALAAHRGCIVNITDVHAERPLKNHSVYSISKAALVMMTKSLARELGPAIRVNAVAPGAILWPENDLSTAAKDRIIDRTIMRRPGEPDDIARAALFLVRDARYTTGQVIVVDGGRSLSG